MGYNIDNIIVNLKKQIAESGGSGGTTDYEDLENLPQINSVELTGNKSLSDLGIPTEADDVSYDNTDSGLTAEDVQSAIDEMCANFGDGVDTVYNAVVAAGATPASKSPADIAAAIGTLAGGGEVVTLIQGVGNVSDPNINETITIPDDGVIIVTGANYVNSSSLTINGGNNHISQFPFGSYFYNCESGPFEVSKNDTLVYTAYGTGSSHAGISVYLAVGSTLPVI